MAVKWIITDLDGCISPEESIPWKLDLFWQFARLSRDASEGKSGLAPITICTGRPQPYAEVLAKILDIRAPIICENGAVIYTLHDNLSRFGPGVTKEKIEGIRAIRGYIDREILPVFPGVLLQFGKESQISIFCEKPRVFASIVPLVEKFVRQQGGPELTINTSCFYLNISLAGVNKGSALTELLKELGATKGEVAGIGDTEGDLPLREAVGFFACPGNSSASIKASANYVSPYPDIEGVLDILKRPEFRDPSRSKGAPTS